MSVDIQLEAVDFDPLTTYDYKYRNKCPMCKVGDAFTQELSEFKDGRGSLCIYCLVCNQYFMLDFKYQFDSIYKVVIKEN